MTAADDLDRAHRYLLSRRNGTGHAEPFVRFMALSQALERRDQAQARELDPLHATFIVTDCQKPDRGELEWIDQPHAQESTYAKQRAWRRTMLRKAGEKP